ncbi:3-galactosyl-N-acetylglucosaminide 4-alpha-L-fucosyltransferase FUT3-like [Sceloporus undulatus]|uniref:3-galactosyl-N-acetylglucosaminide 4-alpha-L-fucosyltransferase FUT3-like n=1 Tax=Sceloporus undulatus TaxID=8520 RepID=UPI001C4B9C59|nr:3-galactosyl-N-acetylglucosaminide 4-alpha-L-fucosyltransferase FUT3-like [Sceloporus undulatus]
MFLTYFQMASKSPPSLHVSTWQPSESKSVWHVPRKRVRMDNGSLALTIFLWIWSFGQHHHLENCSKALGIPNCHFTADQTWHPRADTIVTHHRGVCRAPQLLPQGQRPWLQHWTWFNMEPPSLSPNFTSMDSLFNLTRTYRRDLDIFLPYGQLRVLAKHHNPAMPLKSKMVAWVVSHWNLGSHLEKYFQDLSRYLPMDLYGPNQTLPASKSFSILSKYKFYLAFEDSVPENYITMQFWRNTLTALTMPIVQGPPWRNYQHHLPSGAFIHIDHFQMAKDLDLFLHKLDRSPNQYWRCFRWSSWLEPVLESILATPFLQSLPRPAMESSHFPDGASGSSGVEGILFAWNKGHALLNQLHSPRRGGRRGQERSLALTLDSSDLRAWGPVL